MKENISNQKGFKMKLTIEQYTKLLDYIKQYAMNQNLIGGAWFENQDDFEEWAGDVFYDLLETALKYFGITIDFDSDE